MWNPIKIIKKWNLDRKQAKLNKRYEEEGYSDEILEEQVKLNEERYKNNLKENDYVQ